MQLVNLREHPEFIATLASWHHGQWGDLNPHKTMEMRLAALEKHLGDDAMPVTFIAIEDDRPIGSASLVERDLPTHTHLTPWLASVYVIPERRRRGVGGKLVRRVVDEARRLKVEKLYLFTLDQEPFYTELGWSLVERAEYNQHPIAIMRIELRRSS